MGSQDYLLTEFRYHLIKYFGSSWFSHRAFVVSAYTYIEISFLLYYCPDIVNYLNLPISDTNLNLSSLQLEELTIIMFLYIYNRHIYFYFRIYNYFECTITVSII